ncbi:zinc-ribbon domain-containing protein [Streptomyces virginiae]|uniref:zinc-ribbon domain-containing protein n=1 Tax=Streptomyces virginiae TaxID=1961 RepID=UPI002DBF1676|nr:zinc-ribbon domain-containing protein [Streptomyces sp. CMAA1738]MEC4571070.1 zinc-ribbon domain-containing protein [Streptomyces sp. CMAA1738]
MQSKTIGEPDEAGQKVSPRAVTFNLPESQSGMSRADQYEAQKLSWKERTRAWRSTMMPILNAVRAQVARQEAETEALRTEILSIVQEAAEPRRLAVTDVPALANQWADPADASRVGLRDSTMRLWRCTVEPSHGTWPAPPKDRSRTPRPSMCPRCSGSSPRPGELPAFERSIAAIPPLAAELHPGSGRPEEISYGSNDIVLWRHPVLAVRPGSGEWYVATHVWEQSPKSRTGTRVKNGERVGINGCRVCNSDDADATNSLKSWYPELADQWISAPAGRTPENTPVGSRIDVQWKCAVPEHPEWTAPPNRRTTKALRSGCSKCSTNVSDKQMALFHELRTHLPHLELEAPMVLRSQPGERYSTVRVDMRDEAIRLVVEFDGWKHHGPESWRDRTDDDRRKTQRLHDEGETVIRVREDLDLIGPHDVVVGAGWSAWKVALAVLKRIRQLELHPLPKLSEYEAQGSESASADTEAALLGKRYQPRRAPEPAPQPRKPRELKAVPPHSDSRLTPIGPPNKNPKPRAGSLRDYECACGEKVIGAVQADVSRGNKLSCGCLARESKTRPRGHTDHSIVQSARRWATSQGIETSAFGALDARVLASYQLHTGGRTDLLGADNLIPEEAVHVWVNTNAIHRHSRGRLPASTWRDYANEQLRNPETQSADEAALF